MPNATGNGRSRTIRRRRRALAGLAAALAGCGGLEPAVYRTTAQAAPSQPPQARGAAPQAPAPAAAGAQPKGRWSDDGLRYQEREASTGMPFLPWPLLRSRGRR